MNKITKVLTGKERLPLYSVIHASFLLNTNPVWLLLGSGDKSFESDAMVSSRIPEPEFEAKWKHTVGGRLRFLLEGGNVHAPALASELGFRKTQRLSKILNGQMALHAFDFAKAVNLLKVDPYYLLAMDVFDPKVKNLFECEKLLSKSTDQELVDELISRGWRVQLSR